MSFGFGVLYPHRLASRLRRRCAVAKAFHIVLEASTNTRSFVGIDLIVDPDVVANSRPFGVDAVHSTSRGSESEGGESQGVHSSKLGRKRLLVLILRSRIIRRAFKSARGVALCRNYRD